MGQSWLSQAALGWEGEVLGLLGACSHRPGGRAAEIRVRAAGLCGQAPGSCSLPCVCAPGRER